MKHTFSDIEFSMVSKVISSQMGLYFPIERRDMLSRGISLAAKELGFTRMNEFIHKIISEPLKIDQIEILAKHLTISETYFWREPNVLTALSESAFRELIETKKDGDKSIRIWCAGCSTGEEAYSLAIALCRTIPKIRDWNISILATDINTRALDKARAGIYGTWSFRNTPSWLKDFYFKRINHSEYEVLPEIREMVTFSSFNLIQKSYLSSICRNHKMDIIFCRNVLMYFTKESAARVSDNFFHSLTDNGWFVVSSCELSSELFPQYTPVNFPEAVLYRKTHKKNQHSLSADLTIEEIKPDLVFVEESKSLEVETEKLNQTLLNSDQSFPETTPDYITDRISTIRSFADQGQLESALSLCNEAINTDKLAPGLYFLRASILQGLDKSNEAIKSLRQAVYINPEYVMGHFTLGNLFFRQGNNKRAEKYFKNALNLLKSLANEDILSESDGLSVIYIKDIILASLETKKPI